MASGRSPVSTRRTLAGVCNVAARSRCVEHSQLGDLWAHHVSAHIQVLEGWSAACRHVPLDWSCSGGATLRVCYKTEEDCQARGLYDPAEAGSQSRLALPQQSLAFTVLSSCYRRILLRSQSLFCSRSLRFAAACRAQGSSLQSHLTLTICHLHNTNQFLLSALKPA
jgi:hypothetical protein